ncbi:hypothetical protein V6N13_097783 [Hibiscus sabdariffa]
MHRRVWDTRSDLNKTNEHQFGNIDNGDNKGFGIDGIGVTTGVFGGASMDGFGLATVGGCCCGFDLVVGGGACNGLGWKDGGGASTDGFGLVIVGGCCGCGFDLVAGGGACNGLVLNGGGGDRQSQIQILTHSPFTVV